MHLDKPRVAIDARHLHSGIGTYVRNLLAQLTGDLGFFKTVVLAPRQHQEALRSITDVQMRTANTTLYSAASQVILPFLSRDCDLLHVTNYDIPMARNKPLVVTIYDLHHCCREFAPSYAAWLYAQAMFRIAARKARHIITISEYSKSQIVEKLRVEESKITIAYCGVSSHFREVPKDEALSTIDRVCALNSPYILFVGNLKTHKNLTALLTAFSILYKRRRTSHILVIVGDDQHGRIQLNADIQRLGIHGLVRWMPSIQYEFLPQLYSGADVFVLPSLTEGFGIPVRRWSVRDLRLYPKWRETPLSTFRLMIQKN
jgi:glycosyltransferase involved in cell wall biosynthesis